MIDGVVRQGLEEAIRFLQPGATYRAEVDTHGITIVRLLGNAPTYLVACEACRALVADDVELRRVYFAINKHVEATE